MNWLTLGAYSAISTVGLGIIAYFVKKWMNRVDSVLEKVNARLSSIDITLATLPGNYITRAEYNEQKEHDSKKRESLWIEIKKLDKNATIQEQDIKHLKGT